MFGLSRDEWQGLLLSVNTHRSQRRLSPYQAAQCIERALELTDLDRLASELGFSDTTTLTKIRRIGTLPDGMASLVAWGGGEGPLACRLLPSYFALEMMWLKQ